MIAGVATPPFQEDFEESGGLKVGPMEDQPPWETVTGEAEIVDDAALSGDRSLLLRPHIPATEIRASFGPYPGSDITFVDFFLLPSVGIEAEAGTALDLGTVQVRFIEKGEGAGLEILTPSQNWQDAGVQFPVNEDGQVPDWVRFTFRFSYTTARWDLSIENTLVLFEQEFTAEHSGHLTFLSVTGHPVAATLFDYVYVGPEHPIFENTSRDGISDSFKQEYSLPIDADVRDYVFADGLSAIEKFHAVGRSPSDVTATPGVWIPFFEDFEDRHVGSLHTQGGWVASTDRSALVQQEEAFRGMRALQLTAGQGGAVYHDFLSDHREVWIDFQLTPVFRTVQELPEIPDYATSVFFFDRTGSLTVFDGADGQWKSLSTSRSAIAGQWTGVTLRKNYDSQEWSIWVNSTLVAEGVGFASQAESFSRLHLAQALQNETFVDEIAIITEEPDHLDDDGDGLTNAMERELGTDPRNPDTSGDGMVDGLKVRWGKNPLGHSDVARLLQQDTGRRFTDRFSDAEFAPGNLQGQRGWEASSGAEIAPESEGMRQRASIAATGAGSPRNDMTRFVETIDQPSVWTTATIRFTPGPLPKVQSQAGRVAAGGH